MYSWTLFSNVEINFGRPCKSAKHFHTLHFSWPSQFRCLLSCVRDQRWLRGERCAPLYLKIDIGLGQRSYVGAVLVFRCPSSSGQKNSHSFCQHGRSDQTLNFELDAAVELLTNFLEDIFDESFVLRTESFIKAVFRYSTGPKIRFTMGAHPKR